MRAHSSTFIFFAALLLNGCALLSLEPTEDETYANDPVARAAVALRTERNPAGGASKPRPEDSAFSPRQLTLGMSASRVRDLWGQPQEVESAGEPTSGNQRWIYMNGLKRAWGTSDYRVVYFERNQVVGWENHR